MNYQTNSYTQFEPRSPSSMRSPIESVSLFKKTKRNGWEYSKKDSKTPRGYTGPELLVSDLVGEAREEKVCRIKTRPKSGKYFFPNGLVITGMPETKVAARRMGYTKLTMGAIRINL